LSIREPGNCAVSTTYAIIANGQLIAPFPSRLFERGLWMYGLGENNKDSTKMAVPTAFLKNKQARQEGAQENKRSVPEERDGIAPSRSLATDDVQWLAIRFRSDQRTG
jgi:hypothetical protein